MSVVQSELNDLLFHIILIALGWSQAFDYDDYAGLFSPSVSSLDPMSGFLINWLTNDICKAHAFYVCIGEERY